MEWRSIILKNIRRTMRRYLGYLTASTLAVMVFVLFFSFLFHPNATRLAQLQLVAVVLGLCVFIVAWFAAFFIFYFHATLIRERNKEFGLLMTLGMTPGQIGRMVFLESICIGIAAILLGSLAGLILSPLFFALIGLVVGLPNTLSFAFSPIPLTITVIFFGIVFLLEAAITSWRVQRRTPRILLLGARVRQIPPKISLVKVLLGLACLAGAYIMAIAFSVQFLYNAFPIVILAIVGTFFLYSELLVGLLGILRRRALSGVKLLIVSRLSHRLRDYARILAIVTILNASVLSAMGAVYGFLQSVRISLEQSYPFSLQIKESMEHPLRLTPDQIVETLKKEGLTVTDQKVTLFLTGTVNGEEAQIVSQDAYQQLRDMAFRYTSGLDNTGQIPASLTPDQAYLLDAVPFAITTGNRGITTEGETLTLQFGSQKHILHFERGEHRVLNNPGFNGETIPTSILVVNTDLFQKLQKISTIQQQYRIQSYHLQQVPDTLDLYGLIAKKAAEKESTYWLDSDESLPLMNGLINIILVAGCIVSGLFLIAAGSSLYFKLFTQQEEDRRQFHALSRIGMQKREGIRIIGIEFLVLFFIPVLIAIVHSSVATLDMLHLFLATDFAARITWTTLLIASLIYAACFALYYGVALYNYIRRLKISTVA
ncbi:FtsX-like permease family protein [Thermosporothrix hazakensis]|jgi:ABC-type antimicrobial peptide transport system permease subunit|uniref:FtsX-like permease family protein n=2 Tax=Thermosporothrix TaxID=768650 RepID=A0A326TU35_THEHA|nr:ABC transporter permease [Thermosporothrix hazakensis]PZW19521.1 FtsX-like permease family protein [Thermosporothrix hazakensis]